MTDDIDNAINRLLDAGNLPALSGSTPFAQESMRRAMRDIMASAYAQGHDAAMATQETARGD